MATELPKEITREYLEEVADSLGKEICEGIKKEIPAMQFKVDADKVLRVALDQLGFKTDWSSRLAWFAGGMGAGALGVGLLQVLFGA